MRPRPIDALIGFQIDILRAMKESGARRRNRSLQVIRTRMLWSSMVNTKVVMLPMAQEIAERITIDPAVMVGKPVIKGTRMPVELVLAKLAANPDLDEFLLDYPELTVEDVKAVLAYASTLLPN